MRSLYLFFVAYIFGIATHTYSLDENRPHVRLHFPDRFLWGVALSEYQVSGAALCKESNWAYWENRQAKLVEDYPRSGAAAHFWEHYETDIMRMKKELGINSLRFSVDWSCIEPKEGHFDENALHHYVQLCVLLKKYDIEPMITLHHFTHPEWFEKKGGFERAENIPYFVRFCTKVFKALGRDVHLWCTINEPTIYAFQGYIRGVFPPGKRGFFSMVPTKKAVEVLKNLLHAHVDVYTALKKLPYGHQAQIGFVHQYLKFEPYSALNLFEQIPGWFLNAFLNDAVLHFCATGTFKYTLHVPFLAHINAFYKAPYGRFLDFIGLNYYSRVLVAVRPGHEYSSAYPGEYMTDMPYASYPEGFYEALKHVSSLNVPVYVTENGISDAKDDRRERFIKEYLTALHKALQEGCDIRGFYYWTFVDNYEWDMGYTQKFGLYELDHVTQQRTLRKGARVYAQTVLNNSLLL